MRKSLIFGIALMSLSAMSCNKNEAVADQPQQTAVINVKVVDDGQLQSKAVTAYTTSQSYESAVNDVQLFVFDSDGKINIYQNIGTKTSSNISTTVGSKTVWAVVNAPDLSSIKTESELKASTISLDDNSKTDGFVMAGSNTCTVGSTGASCSVTVSRFVSRIALQKITNNLPVSLGSLVIKNVFISNVVANQNIGGSATASSWYNKEGRADETTRNSAHIIDGSTYKASCAELTYTSSSASISHGNSETPSVPYLFYTFPNSSTVKPSGFSSTFSAQRTVLVITAAVDGETQYYPVALDDAILERNKAYTVEVDITGLGSSDPNKEVEKGSVSVSISVAGWASGATYEETI